MAFLRTLPAEDKARLTERSDRAGLLHLAGHAGLILLFGSLIAAQVPFWWLAIIPQGILIAFLFTLEHEATHKTPFKNETLNEWVGWASGLLIFQPFVWFRYFHLMHHRHTNSPEHDPELAGLPKPDSWPSLLWHLSSISYWGDKAALLFSLAFRHIDAPYLPPRIRPRLRTEARRMLVIYFAALVFTVAVNPVLLWAWLVPLTIGFPVLRLYLLAEHGRCATVANMFDNTRTTFTNNVVRFLAWNMPYHVEHHVFPQVPFHLLPELHSRVRTHLRKTSSGYVAFAKDYVSDFGQTQG